ncbi:MAG: aspartate dehydrogenase [Candidatus Competibacterales bacterium]
MIERTPQDRSAHRVAIVGLGAIGLEVAKSLDQGLPGLQLVGVNSRNREKAQQHLQQLQQPVPVLDLETLATQAEIIVECAPAAAFRTIAEAVIEAGGKTLLTVSTGGLLNHLDLVAKARARDCRIAVASGAIIGLDGVLAAAEGDLQTVKVITRKPPPGLAGAPYFAQHPMDLSHLTEPQRVFAGSALEAIAGFPANVNVAVTVALAGLGPEQTQVEIWADPTLTRNRQTLEVRSSLAAFSLTVESIPSPDNPRTGQLTPKSVLAWLRKRAATLQIGT